MMRSLVPAITLMVAFGSYAAKAADFKAASPVFSWTGCYVGGHAGWMRNNSEVSTTPIGAAADLIGPAGVRANTYGYHPTGSDFSAGAHYGCSRQFGSWVLGLDSSWSWSGLDEKIDASIPPGIFVAHRESSTQQVEWFTTTRARAGYAFDRMMVFVAGGLAAGRVSSEFVWDPGAVLGGVTMSGSEARTRYGWTIGGGAEYALSDNWFLRGEYLYVDLGKLSYDAAFLNVAPEWNARVDTGFHTIRLGLSYRFTGAGSLLEWAQGGFQ